MNDNKENALENTVVYKAADEITGVIVDGFISGFAEVMRRWPLLLAEYILTWPFRKVKNLIKKK